ncbi:MAG: hypothetical protein QGF00_15430 [Planctomycetota bacterium]|jgi:hypothetical protein|nr:hypothetical protein [Planctomycetota bacterium]MDP7250996.1 hypothetical protein [Planctomycetota bacterium]
MSTIWRALVATLTVIVSFAPVQAEEVKHRFICVDNARNRLIHIDQHKGTEWIINIPGGSRDLQILDKERVMVSHGNGAAEYDLNSGKALEWKVTNQRGVNTARRLDNGNTILGSNAKEGIVFTEIDADGKEVSKTVLKGKKNLRLVRVRKDGNFLLTISNPFRVVEANRAGEIIRSAEIPGKGYKAAISADGTCLATTGEDVQVVEINKEGKIARTVGGRKNHEGLQWFSGFHHLDSGNIVVANWLGHGKAGKGPHLVEFDKDNKLVWKWEDHQKAKQITNVLILDDLNGQLE